MADLTADGNNTLYLITTSGSAQPSTIASGVNKLPLISVIGLVRPFVNAENTLPLIQSISRAVAGIAASGKNRLSLLENSARAYINIFANGENTLPLLGIISGTPLYVLIQDAEGNIYQSNSYALVMNTENEALSEYVNYQFNSFAFFNGSYLGANKNGIFELVGDDDDGLPINAVVKTALLDNNVPNQKRPIGVYLGINTNGEMEVFINNERFIETECEAVPTNRKGLGTLKFKAARGMRGRYWSVIIKNEDGSDFALDHIGVNLSLLTRINE